jgi:hypothetical protein
MTRTRKGPPHHLADFARDYHRGDNEKWTVMEARRLGLTWDEIAQARIDLYCQDCKQMYKLVVHKNEKPALLEWEKKTSALVRPSSETSTA